MSVFVSTVTSYAEFIKDKTITKAMSKFIRKLFLNKYFHINTDSLIIRKIYYSFMSWELSDKYFNLFFEFLTLDIRWVYAINYGRDGIHWQKLFLWEYELLCFLSIILFMDVKQQNTRYVLLHNNIPNLINGDLT